MHALSALILALMLGLLPMERLGAQENRSMESQQPGVEITPPRLSFVDGQVSFFRPGDQDWTQARVNMPLSPGDELYTDTQGNLEIQVGARAFVRGWADTRIGLENHEPDYLQFKVTAGHAALDLQALEPGQTVEVTTPSASFTIDREGYYRLDVAGERTAFIARRGGHAVVIPADGTSFAIAQDQEVLVEGAERPTVAAHSAPPPDAWDNWNYARSDRLLDAESTRYVPPGVYGASDLDRHGEWQVAPDYGPVWIPRGVPSGWAPYSTGSWVIDPYYGWTWVDSAPWGWAPYHHGRWVHVNQTWCWAPGPMVARPIYSPALVAFFGSPHGRVGFGATGPVVGWVALGWGEPCVPWWGRPGFIQRPWWGGWGGPRVVNNVIVNRTTVVHVEDIRVYRNAQVRDAVVAVNEGHFTHGGHSKERFARLDAKDLQPMHTPPRVRETPASFAATDRQGLRYPETGLKRPSAATHPPAVANNQVERREGKVDAVRPPNLGPLIVQRRQVRENAAESTRPPFGQSSDGRRTGAGGPQQPAPVKGNSVSSPLKYPENRPPVVERQPGRQPLQPQRPGRLEQTAGRAVASPAPAPHRLEGSRVPVQRPAVEPSGRLASSRAGGAAPQRPEQRGPGTDVKRPTPVPDYPRPVRPPSARPSAFSRSSGGG
jgi:Family of unknown function (DUF6600)